MRSPTSYDHTTGSGPQVSGPMVYGAGHVGTRETLEGREYYPSGGGLRQEWRATRVSVSLDPRLLPRQPNLVAAWFRAVVRWWTSWLVIAGSMAMACGVGYAGWVLGHGTGAVVMVVILAVIFNSTWSKL